jgi:hypothetical protein
MPRQSRIDPPGDLHHVIIHGLERKTILPQNGRVPRHYKQLDALPLFRWLEKKGIVIT